jgi:hypothetical protein
MSGAHAFCSPSGYDGWSRCAGKPALEEQEPDRPSQAADDGTRIHDAVANLIKNATPLEEALTDEGHLAIARGCVEVFRNRMEAYRAEGARVYYRIEEKIDVSWITGEEGAAGSADVVLIAEWGNRSTLEVIDWKTGYREVEVKENGQLCIYLAGALRMPWAPKNITNAVAVIYQPKVREEPQEWPTSPGWLDDFVERTRPLSMRALSLRGSLDAMTALTPGGKQCDFCRAAWKCPALTRLVHEETLAEFEAVLAPMSDGETQVALLNAWRALPAVERWVKAVRAQMIRRMVVDKRPVYGLKTVMGRKGNRFWTNEPKLTRVLTLAGVDGALEPAALKSVAQLEKALKKRPALWEKLAGYVTQKPGSVSVVDAKDPRPEYQGEATIDDFEDVE